MVNPLDFLEEQKLLRFLHVNKNELSCMDNPQTFIRQLRDFNLITKEQHEKIKHMKSKERITEAVYNILDDIETKRSNLIRRFWWCTFKDTMLKKYPTLTLLRNSLMDGSYKFESDLLEEVDSNDTNSEDVPEKAEKEERKGKKRKKTSKLMSEDEDGEEPSTSSQATPRKTPRKTPKKPFFSPLKKGEKGDIWTWTIFKAQLPVSCGDLRGTLNREGLARGEECILMNRKWYSPSDFERLAGKGACRNWKTSIRCQDMTLGKLLQDGHLKCAGFKRTSKTAQKSLFQPGEATSESPESEDGGSDSQAESSSDAAEEDEDEGLAQLIEEARNNADRRLRVQCEDVVGLLHTKRFASGTRGRSIRTENNWLTPEQFANDASCQTTISWKKLIKCEGRPLGVLLKVKVLECHSLLCKCSLCAPDREDVDNQRNDDECWICRQQGTEANMLVQCDDCPRSFHQKCHLPHVGDSQLNDEQQWMCTLCVFKSTLCLYPEKDRAHALKSSISDRMQHCQYLLLSLYRADELFIYKSDPRSLPDYTNVILKPMWLDHVSDNLQNNIYPTVSDFVSDVQLIFTNSTSYNRDNPDIRDKGLRMEANFVKEFNTVFKIQPATR